jgi:glycosyltransferase involved in cell wall biosynthesis
MRLTIVMPVYNAMPFLPDAVDSVLKQTFHDFKLVAVHDGSTDGSLTFLHSIDDPRLQIIETPSRGGQGAARNRVIHACDTEYLAFADADDISLPERFQRQITFLDENPDYGMLGTQFSFISANGGPGMSPPLALDHEAIRQDLLLCRHSVANCTLMFRTQDIRASGGFRIAGAGEDWDLFLRMSERTKVANLNEVLCLYRLHATSTNASQAETLANRYAHACECAQRRERNLPEASFEDFCILLAKRPLWIRWRERMNLLAGFQYRRGIVDVLEGAKIRGYGRMAFGAVISPQKLFQRVLREGRERLRPRKSTPSVRG